MPIVYFAIVAVVGFLGYKRFQLVHHKAIRDPQVAALIKALPANNTTTNPDNHPAGTVNHQQTLQALNTMRQQAGKDIPKNMEILKGYIALKTPAGDNMARMQAHMVWALNKDQGVNLPEPSRASNAPLPDWAK